MRAGDIAVQLNCFPQCLTHGNRGEAVGRGANGGGSGGGAAVLWLVFEEADCGHADALPRMIEGKLYR